MRIPWSTEAGIPCESCGPLMGERLALTSPAAGSYCLYYTIGNLNNQVLVALRNIAKNWASLETFLIRGQFRVLFM